MLESELFALLENTADAAYSVTAGGVVRSWNAAAERLFGHPARSVLGRDINAVLDARDDLGTRALAGGTAAATRPTQRSLSGKSITHFDLEVRTRSGERIWINVSTIVYDDPRTRERLFVRLARDITVRRQREQVSAQLLQAAREVVSLAEVPPDAAPVETLTEQERRILRLFAQGRNPATIIRRLDISAQTLRNHLHHINRKLRTHSRLEAVTHALQRGLLD
ncbi:MAG: PAS domain S-box protein [Gemmatimonadaceae bacterium]